MTRPKPTRGQEPTGRRHSASRRAYGYTLLEMMIAVAFGFGVITVCSLLYVNCIRNTKAAYLGSERTRQLNVAMNQLRADVWGSESFELKNPTHLTLRTSTGDQRWHVESVVQPPQSPSQFLIREVYMEGKSTDRKRYRLTDAQIAFLAEPLTAETDRTQMGNLNVSIEIPGSRSATRLEMRSLFAMQSNWKHSPNRSRSDAPTKRGVEDE